MNYPLIIAHRGASSYAPENTMEAFALAIELGSDYIELDVRKTSDNVLVIHHDPAVVIGGQSLMIKDISYTDLLALAANPVPTLEHVLASFNGRIKFDIELKETGYEVNLMKAIYRHLNHNELVITSFNDESIRIIKNRYPEVRTGLLLGVEKPRNPVMTRYTELFPWKRLKKCGADFAAPHYKLINLLFMKTATRKRCPVFVWTVDRPELVRKLITQKVDGIITNKPDLAATIRAEIYSASPLGHYYQPRE